MDIYAITNESGEALSRIELTKKLSDMGISEEAISSGDSNAIVEDAESKGISLAQLQTELEPTINGSGDTIQNDFRSDLKTRGIPDAVIAQGQTAIQAYAAQSGISLPQPPSGSTLNIKS